MKIKTVTEKEIEAVKYLRNLPGGGYQKAIQGYCTNWQLSEDFVREFRSDITKEMLSLSPKLTNKLVEAYPDLFDLELWRNSNKKSVEIFKSEEFRNQFTTEELNKYFLEINPYELSEETFEDIFPYAETSTKKTLLKIYKGNLSKEFLLKNVDILAPEVFNNESITKDLNKDDLEKLIKTNKNLTMHFLVSALLVRNDIAWQERICTEALDEKIEIQESAGTFDADMKYAIASMHEDVLEKLFQLLNKYCKNAISYSVLEYLLKVKNPSEELCISLLENFKANNLVNALGAYAKEEDYQTLLIGLFL